MTFYFDLLIRISLVVLFTNNLYGNKQKITESSSGVISIFSTKVFWEQWSFLNSDKKFPCRHTFPAPVISKAILFDEEIFSEDIRENSALFLDVNDDNGIYRFYYYSWNNNEKTFNFISLPSYNSSIISKRYLKKNVVIQKLAKVNFIKPIYDAKNLHTNGSCVYMSIRNGKHFYHAFSFAPKMDFSDVDETLFTENYLHYIQAIR